VWAERNRFDFLAAYKSEKKVGKLKKEEEGGRPSSSVEGELGNTK